MNLFEGDKSPETIPLQGFFGLGERIRTSGLLNPIPTTMFAFYSAAGGKARIIAE